MYKPCLRVFCHCCSPPLTLIDISSSSKVFVVTKWTMWKSRKNSKAKERNLELETSFPQLGKPTFPLALPGTLSPDSPKRLPSSPCSPFSSHGHHRCKPGIPSVPRVPAAVFKNQEAPFLPGCLQLSAQRCGFLASCLLGLMLALRRPASLKEPGTLDTQPACLALGSWFQHLADGYRLWRTLVSWHYFSEGLWFFPFSETSPETDFLVPK